MTGFDVNVCAAKWKELKVGEHGDIAVEEFLDACDSIISILDAMGSGLGMVKSDMTGNVGHIRRNAAKFGPGVTLQAMVKKDIEDKVEGKDGSTALSLLWLKRALHFLDQLIVHLLKNAGMEVADAGRAAYADTLTHHHNFAVRQIFKVAITAVPYRKDFMAKIAGSEEQAMPALAGISPSFSNAVLAIHFFLLAAAVEK
ncbi:hypothetical protein KFE25_002526 [Diacronema lutheri]|uniref:Glycolipid transfer protein domain-containing protein n=2 Tax=Diacronema lutheri TaxID=2081491 RepID=A0A8J5X8C8_DIALT|nr:hypothetical protein KFE25_002526 [Diacronema lutheri]